MKKMHLLSFAALGLSMGLLMNSCQKGNAEEMTGDMKSFYEQLTPDAQKKFLELDQKHRKMAMSITEQYCKAPSECKGHREQAVEEQYKHQVQERQGR